MSSTSNTAMLQALKKPTVAPQQGIGQTSGKSNSVMFTFAGQPAHDLGVSVTNLQNVNLGICVRLCVSVTVAVGPKHFSITSKISKNGEYYFEEQALLNKNCFILKKVK